MLGRRLAHYEVLEKIGAGGMGDVYRARDTKLERDVAIKVIAEEFSRDTERLDRFEREAKLLAQLNHANVATLHGLEDVDGQRFLVMELVEGDTLAERIAKGPIPSREAVPLFIQIAEGLEAAHEKGIVHRDLKPANIKLGPDGKAKILDFGLAKAFGGTEAPAENFSQSPTLTKGTALGAILGTAPYMSPEQARGLTVDKRTDVWAFGCCLYEALSGRTAFLGQTVTDTLAGILEREPDWSAVPARGPGALDNVLRRCLRKDARRRLQHIGDARIELEDIRDAPLEESHEPPAPGWTRWAPAFLGVVFLLAGLWMFGRGDRVGPEPVSEARQTQLTANPVENPVLSAAISPDGRYLAYADLSGLFLRLMDTGETRRVILPEGFEVREVDWFPEGTNLLFSAVAEGTLGLWKIPILGGEPRKLREKVWRASVSPDGSWIAFLDEPAPSHAVQVMGPNGENPRKIAEAEAEDSFVQLAWSPDGERLAYGKWHSGPAGLAFIIESIHLESGRTSTALSDPRLFQDWRGFLPFQWTPDGRLIYALRDLPPNHDSSNLWALSIDLNSGETSGSPARVTQLAGFNFADLSVTADGKKLSYLLERNQSDIYVGELADRGQSFTNVRRLTLDERNDYPSTWMPDSRKVLFHSNRGGEFALWQQDLQETGPKVVATIGPTEEIYAAVDATGAWILHWDANDLMRLPATGGPSDRVLTTSWAGEDTTNRGFRCGRTPSSGCVLGERDTSRTEYVFSSFAPVAGRGDELLRVEDKPPFTFWDLSPDGTRVALVHRDGRIRLIELSTGSETVLAPKGWMGGEHVAWSADGKSLFVDGDASGSATFKMGLHQLTLEGAVHVLRSQTNEWNVYPVPSPDGRYLAFGAMVFSGNAMLLEDF